MSVYFPSNIKPIISNYSFGTPDNVRSVPTLGGAPLQILDFKYGPVDVNVNIIGDRFIKTVLSDFYYGKINSGASKFYMNLDTGLGLEEHECYIVPQTMQFNGQSDPTWSISFTARCIRTPAQDAPYDGNLVDLYAEYGDEIDELLAALNVFSNVDLDLYFSV